MVLWVFLANGCLIEAKGISSRQKETEQACVFMFFLPETIDVEGTELLIG